MKVQGESVLKYLDFWIIQSPLGFSVDQNDNIMELVNEWFPAGKFRKVDVPFGSDYTHGEELMTTLQ